MFANPSLSRHVIDFRISVICYMLSVINISESQYKSNTLDITNGNCHVCFDTVSGSHMCVVCRRSVHVFCGKGVGEEGYGQAVTCYKCLDTSNVFLLMHIMNRVLHSF